MSYVGTPGQHQRKGHTDPAVCSPRSAPCTAESHRLGPEVVPFGHPHARLTSSWGTVREAAPEMPAFKPKAWKGVTSWRTGKGGKPGGGGGGEGGRGGLSCSEGQQTWRRRRGAQAGRRGHRPLSRRLSGCRGPARFLGSVKKPSFCACDLYILGAGVDSYGNRHAGRQEG